MKLRILLFLSTLKIVTDLFGSFLPSLQIIKLLQKQYNVFMFRGMTLGLLVFKNVKILFLSWHTGRWLWEEVAHVWELYVNRKFSSVSAETLERVLNLLLQKFSLPPHTGHVRPAAHRCSGVFSVSICFPLSSYCGRLRLVRRLLETSILHDCYLEDISKYIMWIASLHQMIVFLQWQILNCCDQL